MINKKLKLFALTVSIIFAVSSGYACELFGFSFSKPVPTSQLLEQFWKNGNNNPHGWGIVYKEDGKLKIIKEETNASTSKKAAETVKMPMHKKLLVAHVRKMKIGKVCYENTHPFKGKNGNKELALVQNGKVVDYKKYKQDNFKPVGTCDSEFYLCYILDKFKSKNLGKLTEKDLAKLHKYFINMNAHKDNWTNNLVTDGNKLIVYQDNKDFNTIKVFHYVDGQASSDKFKKELKIDIPAGSEGYLFAAKPVAVAADWKKMQPGQMMVIEDGIVLYDKLREQI
ncbi:MAG: hypothetical protein GY750_13700 [Lentisphaerae bacterium]|nr:hypothetical protein [Lentisphaerota bacterium]MCP4102457.1 hypothetical protein [Lentisphaerota bacterium]